MKYLLLIASIFCITSCYYHNEEELFPDTGLACDTTDISYSNAVQPVLENRCYGCHDNTSAAQWGGNIKLEDYQDVKLRVEEGSLLGSVRHESNYSPMPRGGRKLDNCTLTIIQLWIEDNAPDN